MIAKNLNSKYLTGMDYYNVKVVNDVIYNDTTHLVSVFKDYLIYDDISEFLKRYYNMTESLTRLNKIYDFYDKYSKVFPNYIILEENKFMFKNIERKQIAIDERQQFFQELEEKQKSKKQKESKEISKLFEHDSNMMFDTNFYDSVRNIKTNSQISESFPFDVASSVLDSHIQNCNMLTDSKQKSSEKKMYEKASPEIPFKRLEDYNIQELVDKFLVKDSNLLDASSIILPSKENKPGKKTSQPPKVNIDKIKAQMTQNKPKQVFNYQEIKAKYINDVVQIPRQNKSKDPKMPSTQNFMPTHRKNVYSNDGRTRPHEKFTFQDKQMELKNKYNEMRKQKRPKSSDTQAATYNVKTVTSKPVLFSTIDNRKPNAFISQKYLSDTQRTPSDMVQ